jgi:drug/metabolite transporter (DMT)-like permease
VATLFVLGSWAVGGPPDLAPLAHPGTVLLLLGVGLTATLGQVCITRAFTAGQPERVSVVGLTQIVFALGLDVLFRGPDVRPVTLAGIALVLAPTAWVMAGRARRPAKKAPADARSAGPRPYYLPTATATPASATAGQTP